MREHAYYGFIAYVSVYAYMSSVSPVFRTVVTVRIGLIARIMSLNLNGTNPGKPSTRPPSCTTPQQLTIYLGSL